MVWQRFERIITMEKSIYVFRTLPASRKEMLESSQLSMIKTGRVTQVTPEEMKLVSVEGELYYLIQGYDVIGMAFDYNTACKGFRIMSHQQYIDNYYSRYPIEIVTWNDVSLDLPDDSIYLLRYVEMY